MMSHTKQKMQDPTKSEGAALASSSLRPTMKDVERGLRVGLLFALGFSVIAAIIHAAEGAAPFEQNGTSLSLVVALYGLGFGVAGLIVGAFHRLAAHHPPLAYFVGIIAATPISFATTAMIGHHGFAWDTDDWLTAVVASVIYGVLGVRFFRKDPIKWE